jgi:hypothetical protein
LELEKTYGEFPVKNMTPKNPAAHSGGAQTRPHPPLKIEM